MVKAQDEGEMMEKKNNKSASSSVLTSRGDLQQVNLWTPAQLSLHWD